MQVKSLGGRVKLGKHLGPLIDRITVWKFLSFSVIQILREINFWKFRSSKNWHFDIFEALKLDFDDFLQLLKAGILPKNKIQSPWTTKTAVFDLPACSKLISRKIWMVKKFWNSHSAVKLKYHRVKWTEQNFKKYFASRFYVKSTVRFFTELRWRSYCLPFVFRLWR